MAWFIGPEEINRGQDEQSLLSPKMEYVASDYARFQALGKQLAEDIEARYMAGPRDSNSPDYPWFGVFDYPPPLYGWRWPDVGEPFRAQLEQHQGALIDILATDYGYAISQRLIDMIEAIEPGVHHYLPLEILQPDGSVHPDKRWLLNICARAEVVDMERSNVVWMKDTDGWFTDRTKDRHIVLKAAEAKRRAIWFEWRYHAAPSKVFISDAFWDALQAAGVRGWEPNDRYPHHMDEI